jgi:hypothetical protein
MPKILPKPWYKKIIDNLAVKHKKDRRVIEYVAHYPFSFLKQVMKDESNPRPVRLRHLGVFHLKRPDLKDIVYEKRMIALKKYMPIIVEAGLFESEEAGLLAIEKMSKEDINSFYKNKVVRLL